MAAIVKDKVSMAYEDMAQLTPMQAKDFVRFVVRFNKSIPKAQRKSAFLHGQPGSAKTSIIRQLAAENDNDIIVTCLLSQYDSVDFRGTPMPDDSGFTTWFPAGSLPFKGNPKFAHVKGTIWLFLDELPAAAMEVQAVALQLCLELRVGEFELMDNVVIVAAGNRDGDKAIVNKMPTALNDRFCHCEVIITVEGWIEYQAERGVLPPITYAFYMYHKDLLNTFDPARNDKAFSTSRSAEAAWEAWLVGQSEGMLGSEGTNTILAAVFAGFVGKSVQLQAWSFIETWDSIKHYMPDIRKNGKTAPVPKEDELGLMWALAVAVSGEMDTKTVANHYAWLQRLPAPEFSIMGWTLAQKRDKSLLTTPTFVEFAKEFRQVFRVA